MKQFPPGYLEAIGLMAMWMRWSLAHVEREPPRLQLPPVEAILHVSLDRIGRRFALNASAEALIAECCVIGVHVGGVPPSAFMFDCAVVEAGLAVDRVSLDALGLHDRDLIHLSKGGTA